VIDLTDNTAEVMDKEGNTVSAWGRPRRGGAGHAYMKGHDYLVVRGGGPDGRVQWRLALQVQVQLDAVPEELLQQLRTGFDSPAGVSVRLANDGEVLEVLVER
jgi:hypothetical protein